MARLITGRPGTYTINKINRTGGIYRPYGLNGYTVPVYIGPFAPPAGQAQVAYSYDAGAAFGPEPGRYSASALPAGLGISAISGIISGTPTNDLGETVSCIVTKSNARGQASTPAADIVIAPVAPPLPINLNIDALKQCFELQGWTPVKQNAVTLFFPLAGATLTLAQCEACDLDHLPGPLRVDARACIQAQGGCNG